MPRSADDPPDLPERARKWWEDPPLGVPRRVAIIDGCGEDQTIGLYEEWPDGDLVELEHPPVLILTVEYLRGLGFEVRVA